MNHSKEIKTTGAVNLRELLKKADKPKNKPTPPPPKKSLGKKGKDGKT